MLEIQQKFIRYNYTPRNPHNITYLVLHDVGTKNSTAFNNYNYFNSGDRDSSADFFVDNFNIIQTVDYTKGYSWHCGDGHGIYGITNANSIGVEMCLVEPFDTVIQNTIDLVKYLMKELNIPIENVVRHFDASRKCCPKLFSDNNWGKWFWFKEQLITSSSFPDNPSVKDCVNEFVVNRAIISDQGLWTIKGQCDENLHWLFLKFYNYIIKNDGSVKDIITTSDDAIAILQKQSIVSDFDTWNQKAYEDECIKALLIKFANYIC